MFRVRYEFYSYIRIFIRVFFNGFSGLFWVFYLNFGELVVFIVNWIVY